MPERNTVMSETYTIKRLTLCLIHTDTHLLLGMKKRGFGANKWTGFGGKLESGETLEQAACREVQEECALTILPENLTKRGILHFTFEEDSTAMEVHVFTAQTYEGTPTETDEMAPQWYPLDALPFDSMWEDDQHWLPTLFGTDHKFYAHFHFNTEPKIIDSRLIHLASFDEAPSHPLALTPAEA